MSCTVKNNEIVMTRGDTFQSLINIYVNSKPYTPVNGDTVRFAMKHKAMTAGNKQYVDQEPILTKTIPISTMILTIDPADTKALDFDEYVYDLQITFADGRVSTFVENEKITITPEVD